MPITRNIYCFRKKDSLIDVVISPTLAWMAGRRNYVFPEKKCTTTRKSGIAIDYIQWICSRCVNSQLDFAIKIILPLYLSFCFELVFIFFFFAMLFRIVCVHDCHRCHSRQLHLYSAAHNSHKIVCLCVCARVHNNSAYKLPSRDDEHLRDTLHDSILD